MRDILELSIDLDRAAEHAYAAMAAATSDPELKRTFMHLGAEEKVHVQWWSDLLDAWKAGLVPDLASEHELLGRLRELGDEVSVAIPDDFTRLTTDQMLDVAAHLEFYMLDPVFGELLDLTGPGSAHSHREAYSRHVMRLVKAIEEHHSQTDLARFLARVLVRTFRDQKRLASLATHDQLTGMYNRRGLYGYINQWTSWASRYGHAISVVLIDVDHFKRVNDLLGHPAGDDALKAVSEALGEAIRGSDLVGRHGGDEFAILAPETGAEELVVLMERVLAKVRSTRFEVDGTPVELTVSVGGAYVESEQASLVTPEQLLAAADRSLYEAKDGGRDRAGSPRNPAATSS